MNRNYDINDIASIINDASIHIIDAINGSSSKSNLKALVQNRIQNLNLSVRHRYYVNNPETEGDCTVLKVNFYFAGRDRMVTICFRKDNGNNTTATIEGPEIVVSTELDDHVNGFIHSDCLVGNSILYLDWFSRDICSGVNPLMSDEILGQNNDRRFDSLAINSFICLHNELDDSEAEQLMTYDIYMSNLADKNSEEYMCLKSILATRQNENRISHIVLGTSWMHRKKSYAQIATALDNLYQLNTEFKVSVVFYNDYHKESRVSILPQAGIDAIEHYYASKNDPDQKDVTIEQFFLDYGIKE